MPELTREEKIKIFESLPKAMQDLMSSEDTSDFLLFLMDKYKLEMAKVHLLSKIVGDVILGITPMEKLTEEIKNNVSSDGQVAVNISKELEISLFLPIKESAAPGSAGLPPDKYREAPKVPIQVPAPKPFAPSATLQVPAPQLMEADPHKTIAVKEPEQKKPERLQFIMRPPGLPPTDLPSDILNLRKDK